MSDSACNLIQPLLGAYLDGEVAPETAESLSEHLEACAGCCGILEQLAETDRLVRGVRPDYPTEVQWAQVEARLMARIRARGWWQSARAAAYAAAAVVVIAASLWLVSLLDRGTESIAPAGGGVAAQGAGTEETPIEITIERG